MTKSKNYCSTLRPIIDKHLRSHLRKCKHHQLLYLLELLTSRNHKNKFGQFNNTSKISLQFSVTNNMSNFNKHLCFMDYDVIGFDLDFTVLRYNINEATPMVYNFLRQYLVEKKSYSRALLEAKIDKDFMQKGLLLDIDRGNILKIDGDGTILRASHGTTALTHQQIINIYGEKKKWDLCQQFLENPLSMWNGPLSMKLRMLLDYFDLSVGLLFAQVVDLVDAQKLTNHEPKQQVYTVYADILDGLIEQFNPNSFLNGKSSYFNEIRKQPERYLLRTHPSIINWLKKLRDANKFLVLITGSQADFANLTATYALGKGWETLFDSVVFKAKKPGFFVQQRPFLHVESMQEILNSELNFESNMELNRQYTGGNWQQLLRTFALKSGKSVSELRCIYVGDNVFLDVYIPAKHCGMHAIAVCEELLAEHSKDKPDDNEYRDYILSKFWGSYFKMDNRSTYWMQIITNFSEMCIPSLQYLAEKPITHTFTSYGGFYPRRPDPE